MIKNGCICDRCNDIIDRSREIAEYKKHNNGEDPFKKYPSNIRFLIDGTVIDPDLCLTCLKFFHEQMGSMIFAGMTLKKSKGDLL